MPGSQKNSPALRADRFELIKMTYLPCKIMKMIEILHSKGYSDIYLYCGMSASGTNWRFIIGKITDNVWPGNQIIACGSLSESGEVEWSSDTGSAESLADDFERYYALTPAEQNSIFSEYATWYSEKINTLQENELLVFYADYPAPHQDWLLNAPGYR